MITAVKKPDQIRNLGPVDTTKLTALVSKLPEKIWNSENEGKENNFFCFTNTRHIIFRFFEPGGSPEAAYSHPIWQAWQDTLTPILTAASSDYGYKNPMFPKVMLARLASGHIIDTHVDAAESNKLVHKIHIPLITNPDAKMMIDDHLIHLEFGHAYEVNNIVKHGVENRGGEDRIHLIYELYDAG